MLSLNNNYCNIENSLYVEGRNYSKESLFSEETRERFKNPYQYSDEVNEYGVPMKDVWYNYHKYDEGNLINKIMRGIIEMSIEGINRYEIYKILSKKLNVSEDEIENIHFAYEKTILLRIEQEKEV